MTPHYLDWSNIPGQTKTYPSSAEEKLVPVQKFPDLTLRQLLESPMSTFPKSAMNLQTLSRILMLAYGITARQKAGGQIYRYRCVPSAGALYPAEIYVGWPNLAGLEPGIYYYHIDEFLLKKLRTGDPSRHLQRALSLKAPHMQAVTFLLSGIFFRSAWKYRKRAFRYVMLDIGHLTENLYQTLRLFGFFCSVHYDFDDVLLCRLAGLDSKREACFVCLNCRVDEAVPSHVTTRTAGDLLPLPEAFQNASRVAVKEDHYREIEDIYRISSQRKIAVLTSQVDKRVVKQASLEWFQFQKPDRDQSQGMPFAEAVWRRRSRRNFVDTPFSEQDFMQLLDVLISFSAEGTGEESGLTSYLKIGFLAGNVDGLDPGFYLISRAKQAFGLIAPGNLNQPMANACLDQEWLKLASLQFLFMANLKAVDAKLGPRGYRHVMMNAGRLGQRLYLAATALGAGCCGIGAFYDSEAQNLLSLNDDSALLYLVAVGQLKGKRFQASFE
jgi:SagB-type dehydrogenase family enzyme